MTTARFALFDTPIGRCAIAWGPAGHRRRDASRTRRWSDARTTAADHTPAVRKRQRHRTCEAVVDDIQAPAGWRGTRPVGDRSRHERAYRTSIAACIVETRSIPPGETLTYGEIATRLGDRRSRRAPSGRRSGGIRSRSSCRAIACSRPVASREGSRLRAVSRRSDDCSRSKEPAALHPTLPWDRQPLDPDHHAVVRLALVLALVLPGADSRPADRHDSRHRRRRPVVGRSRDARRTGRTRRRSRPGRSRAPTLPGDVTVDAEGFLADDGACGDDPRARRD